MSKKFNTHGAAAFFSGNNANVQEVQQVQDVQEVEERRTQGKKGAKLPRAHISLSPAMYKHLRIASATAGMTMSEYIEDLLRADKEKSPRID